MPKVKEIFQKDKYSAWFPATVSPINVGVYQGVYASGVFYYRFFNGMYFSAIADTPANALKLRNIVAPMQEFDWRGLNLKC